MKSGFQALFTPGAWIEGYRGFSHGVITFQNMKIYPRKHETAIMLDYNEMCQSQQMQRDILVCVESGKIPPLCKLKQLICEASLLSIDTAHTAKYKAVPQNDCASFSIIMDMYSFDDV